MSKASAASSNASIACWRAGETVTAAASPLAPHCSPGEHPHLSAFVLTKRISHMYKTVVKGSQEPHVVSPSFGSHKGTASLSGVLALPVTREVDADRGSRRRRRPEDCLRAS